VNMTFHLQVYTDDVNLLDKKKTKKNLVLLDPGRKPTLKQMKEKTKYCFMFVRYNVRQNHKRESSPLNPP